MASYEVQTDGGTYQVDTEDTPQAPAEQPSIPQAAGHAFVNNLPMGGNLAAATESLPGVGTGKGYSENLENWNAQTPIDKAAHPAAYRTGAVAGALAPAALSMGETLPAQIAANAGLGALSAAGNTNLVKEPGKALGEAAIGGAIGGGTAGLLGKLLPTTEGLENLASKKAIQSIEMPSGIVGAMEPEERASLGKFIQENNLVGRDKPQMLEQARKLSDQFGKKIGEVGDKSSDLMADRNVLESKIQGLIEKAHEYTGFENKEANTLESDYRAGARDVFNKIFDDPSWKNIQKLKEQYGKLAFDSKGEIKSEGAKDTYFALKDMLKNIAEKAQNSNLAPEYKQALAGYSTMQPIESGLEKSVDAELRGTGSGMGVRGMIGLIRKLPGPARAVLGPTAALMGHPYVGAMAALPELTNPALQSKAASAVAPLATKGSQVINQLLRQYLINQFQKKKNAD